MIPSSPLDDPRTAAHAWARYKRLMQLMAAFTCFVIACVLALLYAFNGMISVHLYIASALGVGFTMMLASALMGLVFLSNGTGHDKAIVNPFEEGEGP